MKPTTPFCSANSNPSRRPTERRATAASWPTPAMVNACSPPKALSKGSLQCVRRERRIRLRPTVLSAGIRQNHGGNRPENQELDQSSRTSIAGALRRTVKSLERWSLIRTYSKGREQSETRQHEILSASLCSKACLRLHTISQTCSRPFRPTGLNSILTLTRLPSDTNNESCVT